LSQNILNFEVCFAKFVSSFQIKKFVLSIFANNVDKVWLKYLDYLGQKNCKQMSGRSAGKRPAKKHSAQIEALRRIFMEQGDQIGRFLKIGQLITLGSYFDNYKRSTPNLGILFPR
jgi:hypothetical protein